LSVTDLRPDFAYAQRESVDFATGGCENILEFGGCVVGIPDDVGITLTFACGSIETGDLVSA